MSINQAAEYIGLTKKTVWDLIRKGKIPAYKPPGIFRRYILSKEEIDEWIRSGYRNNCNIDKDENGS